MRIRGSILGYAVGLLRTRRAFLAACAALPSSGAAGATAADEYGKRRRALAEAIGRGAIALLGSTESEGRSGFTGFRQESSFFYLTGHEEPGAAPADRSRPRGPAISRDLVLGRPRRPLPRVVRTRLGAGGRRSFGLCRGPDRVEVPSNPARLPAGSGQTGWIGRSTARGRRPGALAARAFGGSGGARADTRHPGSAGRAAQHQVACRGCPDSGVCRGHRGGFPRGLGQSRRWGDRA